MKRETFFLKVVVILLAMPVLAMCIFLLPWVISDASVSDWEYAYLVYPVSISMYASTIPFFIALYQAYQLLSYIDKNEAFSELSVRALRKIKFCAIAIGVLYVMTMPFFYLIGEKDDAPGVILIGLVLAFTPMVIAVFAAVLQKLFKNAIAIKSENDLTV
ncbi:DUF2975 domain-containing protein [Alkalihalobacillus macyae]|uniref:DUF2975 domain-containing protein n=1 Tax=Guptibacillus hwajinpoensis TaxID=208199 RepID=UPI00273C27A2|nr:DUF2975 domain-containing protein [Alkalihalobacillus macyae]MDP4549609.1 DUF2975 domain-containing protein [Alkalihalobacillus macyae]